MLMSVTGELKTKRLLTSWYFWVLVALAIYSLLQPPTYFMFGWGNILVGPVTSISALVALILGLFKWLWVLVQEINLELNRFDPSEDNFWDRWFLGRWSPFCLATDDALAFALMVWSAIQASMGIGWVLENYC